MTIEEDCLMAPEESRKEELKYYSHPAMQEKFEEVMRRWQPGDRYIIPGSMDIFTVPEEDAYINKGYHLRCPLSIDAEHPERGLWGMVNWTMFWPDIDVQSKMHIRHRPKNEHDWNEFRATGTPTLALLKALAAQWGVEP